MADEAQGPGSRTLAAGRDGSILLSTDAAASAVAAAEGADGAALFAVDAIRVGEGETLVVRAANGQPVRVETGVLEVAARGRVVAETFLELHADRAVFAADSAVVLVGADGQPGRAGGEGARGNRAGNYHGGAGGNGDDGTDGKPGPGGNLYFQEITGRLTVVAGGGHGGAGGSGGRGGDGVVAIPGYLGNGGNGGAGGARGSGGDGGTVVIAFGTLVAGSVIQPTARCAQYGAPGPGGAGGAGANGHTGQGAPGVRGQPGPPGANGESPVFLLRPRD